jgi:hypothetical protein
MEKEKAAILVVGLSVPPDKEPRFNEFYNHCFLPKLLKETPEFIRVTRFEEFGVGGTLRWYNKQFLTIYELESEECISKVDSLFGRPAVADVVKTFREWKDNELKNFSRITYRHTWIHARRMPSAGWPWMFVWQLETKPEMDAEFQTWYQNDYLPLQVASINWTGCRRYASVDRDPRRHLTLFEAADEANLVRCLIDLRSPHRVNQNYAWQERVGQAVNWHDATSFKPIYRFPD